MTDDIRQKLRDYARDEISTSVSYYDVEPCAYTDIVVGQRGELAPLAFVALQNVLDAIGDDGPVDANTWIHGRIILAAIAKAFE